jgi:hypothetical protein
MIRGYSHLIDRAMWKVAVGLDESLQSRASNAGNKL